jgi:hypothetical protein
MRLKPPFSKNRQRRLAMFNFTKGFTQPDVVAPEILAAWEKTNDCDLRRQFRKYVWLNKILLCLVVLIVISFFCIILTAPPSHEVNVPLMAISIFLIILSLVLMGIQQDAGDKISKFGRDVAKLAGEIGSEPIKARFRMADSQASRVMIIRAGEIQLAQLGGDLDRGDNLKKEMVDCYNFFAGFNLVAKPVDPENPELRQYFSEAKRDTEIVVTRMYENVKSGNF